MSQPPPIADSSSLLSRDQLIEQICGPFEEALKATSAPGQTPRVEDYLGRVGEAERSVILRELVLLEVHYRCRGGEAPQTSEYQVRFPELDAEWLSDALAAAPTKVQARLPGVAASPGPGTLFGPYKLVQPIGQGGMGTVFLAEQLHPVQRQVALKLIKPGFDSHQVIARFEAERQALALMDHPNIAKVLDAGTVGQAFQPDTPSARQAGKPDVPGGRPYFVMELVRRRAAYRIL